MRRTRQTIALVCALVVVLGAAAFASGQPYEAYFMYRGNNPYEEEPPFSDNFQGIAHDPDHWFVSHTIHDCGKDPDAEIWKVPVQYELGDVTGSEPDVYAMVLSRDYPALLQAGYWHIGEIDYYKGFVVAPVEKCGSPHSVMLFSGDNLDYVGMATVPGLSGIGWVAVNPANGPANGHIYTSADNITAIEEYRIDPDWENIPKHPSTPLELTLTHVATVQLRDSNGAPLTDLFNSTQGGTFSESGSMFYFLVGFLWQVDAGDGLHAFDTQTWRRVMRSSRTGTTSCMDFYYYWLPGDPASWDEPEGIDVWDLDNEPRSPYWGQLHVGVLDNDADQDDLSLCHYTRSIYADSTYSGSESGRQSTPFNTIGEAHNLACDGAWIKMAPGTYPDAVTLNKRVKLVPNGGTAILGAQGRISLTASTNLNLYTGGGMRLY